MVSFRRMATRKPRRDSAPLSERDFGFNADLEELNKKLPIPTTKDSEVESTVTAMAERGKCPVDGYAWCGHPGQCVQLSSYVHWNSGYFEIRCPFERWDSPPILHFIEGLPRNVQAMRHKEESKRR